MPDITVVLASVGNDLLHKCIESLSNHTLSDRVQFMVGVDGEENLLKVDNQLGWYRDWINLFVAPQNTGKGIGGYKLYAGSAFLTTTKYITFLDEDNMVEPNHLESLYNLAEKSKLDFAYSLRQIIDERGKFVVNDDCESLGKWPIWNRKDYHIDTSCYLFNREFFIDKVSRHWYFNGHDADRRTYNIGLRTYNHACTGLYTLKYRIRDADGKERRDYFIRGSEFNALQTYYGKGFPWTNPESTPTVEQSDEQLDLTRRL